MAEKNKELAESKNMTNIPGMGLVEDPFENEVDDAKDPGKAYYEEHTVGAIYIPKFRSAYLYLMKPMLLF